MDEQTWAKANVARASAPFIPLRLDTERYPAFADRFGVEILPTTLVIDPNERLVTSVPGVVPAEDMRDLLGRVIAGWDLYQRHALSFGDPDALLLVADYLGDIGNIDGGANLLRVAGGVLRSQGAERGRIQVVELKLAQASVLQGKLNEAESEFDRLSRDGEAPEIRAGALAGLVDIHRRRGKGVLADRVLARLHAEYPEIANELGL
jgi:thioredoxin-like negative regulator of GroEL